MTNILWKNFDDNINGYTLVIPSVAVGNVGQLACDLLISSLKMKKFTSIYSTALIPVVGYDPYVAKSSSLCGSCDIYKSDDKKLIVLQIRAPLIHKYARSFLEDIVSRFQNKQVRDIIVLTSSFAHEKKNIPSSPFRYAGNSNLYSDQIRELSLLQHETQNDELKIYGGGFASLLYKICEEKSVPCLVLFKYCSEGDNIPDAYDMVNCLNNIHLTFPRENDLSSHLIQPISWKLLFGRPPPIDIY